MLLGKEQTGIICDVVGNQSYGELNYIREYCAKQVNRPTWLRFFVVCLKWHLILILSQETHH